ncbi:MAG TPA: tetratricopeptide repeat protein, partial [Methyloceanibacter sp.]|nr:tetratricopeptide repeat protein [Methyloceanibacter sp.]
MSEELVKLNQEIYQRLKAGEYGRALPIAEQALGIAERLYGPDDPAVAVELRSVAQVLQAAGRSAEAEPLMRRALAIDEKNLGPDDPSIALDLKILTGLLVDVTWKNNLPQTDRDRIVLTGQLPDVLERAVPLALIASLLLLWIYRRAVMLSMRRRAASAERPAAGMDPKLASVAPALPLQIVTTEDDSARGPASKVESRALNGPWLNAAVYSVAGLGYVVALTSAFLYAGGFAFLPIRFAVNALALAWPVVLTIGLVAANSWRGWLTAALIYFLLFAALSAVGMARSETLTWDQPIRLWLLTNLPGTFLILAFLPRQIRAVGPMVLVFMIAAVGGSTLWHNVFEVSPRLMLPVVDFFGSLGFSGMKAVDAATYAFQLFGALVLALIGWMFLRGLGKLYRLRWISDQSVIVDSLWFLFALTSAIDFAFFGIFWFLAPLAAFAIYKIMSVLGFAILRQRPAGTASDPTLLLLRVFSLGKRSALLFNAFGRLWCHGGSMRLIAGPDLATSTVEPHEFLDFLSGKLARRFISGPETLARRLAETEPRRDFDGRYRVADFFCHDDTWRMVLARLARESDAVLMDLRNFSPSNQGCIFEINELLDVVPLDRVVFVVDETTDQAFLREILTECWAA